MAGHWVIASDGCFLQAAASKEQSRSSPNWRLKETPVKTCRSHLQPLDGPTPREVLGEVSMYGTLASLSECLISHLQTRVDHPHEIARDHTLISSETFLNQCPKHDFRSKFERKINTKHPLSTELTS